MGLKSPGSKLALNVIPCLRTTFRHPTPVRAVLRYPEQVIESPAVLDPANLVGSMLGSYRLVRLIGSGGMGWVFEGRQEAIGSRVAIKVLDPEVANAPTVVERFFNEARAVNLIGHRNLVQILDLAHEHNCYYLVMELLKGQPLSTLLSNGQPMSLAEAGPILIQCAEALQAAHQRSVIHRDIKPANIFVVTEEDHPPFVKIVDFGIAKLAMEGSGVTRTAVGVVMGTPAYMSPEQAEGAAGRIDGRSDIYSLGVVMFQMATGSLPFSEPTNVKMLMAHVGRPPPRPQVLVPTTPWQFEEIILRCLAKAPQDRFQSMSELRDALITALKDFSLGPAAQGAAPFGNASHGSIPLPLSSVPAATSDFGGGLPGEPLPGAEMFDPPPVVSRPTPEPRTEPPPDEPLELDLAASPLKAAPGRSEPDPEPEKVEARTRPRRRAFATWSLIAGAAGVALVAWSRAPRPQALPATTSRLAAIERLCAANTTRAAAPPVVELQVLTHPARARVRATWGATGCNEGITPWRVNVPRGARVHLHYSLAGLAERDSEVLADDPQVVLESLAP